MNSHITRAILARRGASIRMIDRQNRQLLPSNDVHELNRAVTAFRLGPIRNFPENSGHHRVEEGRE
jgi:hypothetical protein